MKSEYLVVLSLVLIAPLILSITMRLNLFRRWRAMLGAILASTAVYGSWDVIVTARGHWEFNPAFVLGATLFGLPLEEWLFFIIIGFVSIFTYEAVKKQLPGRP